MNAYFLAKTDPDTYSIDDLEKDGKTVWDGVHNYQAINVIKTMKKGDLVYVYHSQDDKAIVGLMEVISEPYQNTKDPRHSWAIDVRFVKKYDKHITLKEMKESGEINDFILLRHSRLSTMAVPHEVHQWIEKKLKV